MSSSTRMTHEDFFTEYGEANRFTIHEVIGKGSYGVVCSATDNKTGLKVAIKNCNVKLNAVDPS
jgi:mitogen-activated protein kinase 1/3